MSLQFIFGNSGSGKSYYLHKTIVEQSIKNPKKNYIVLVPEQFTMQTQKDLVMAHPNKGIMNIDVLSFGRLAYRIFEETGGNKRIILDDTGKSLILRKIAGDNEEQLKILRGNLKKRGYISEMKSVISEFTQYDVDQNVLDRMLEQTTENTYLYWKLKDIAKVYEGFQSYLSDKYITNEELLDVLCQIVGQSEILKDSVIVLDGFTGFTPVQNRLLRELLHICEKIVVTVTMDQREDPYVFRHKYQLFALSKQMVSGLLKIAKEEGVLTDEPVLLYGNPAYRFKNNEPLSFLEQNLFRYTKKIYDKPQDQISIHSARSPKEEALFIAEEIRRLVRTKGYRYREIAVIAGDVETYADYFEKAFDLYHIPVFMDRKRSVLLNSFVEYIRSLLSMIEQNFTYESVFRFLRTGLTSFTNDEIDRMENYVIAFGIRGYKKWNEKWIRSSKEIQEEDLEVLNHTSEKFISMICDVTEVLKRKRKTVEEITLALHDFFIKEELQKKVENYEKRFQEMKETALAKEYSQIYKIVIEIFDKFIELLGDVHLPLKEYCELLDAGFEEAKVGITPPQIDQVVIGDIERTRLKDIKVLFFAGANDSFIPTKNGSKGLLSEQDREFFEANDVALAPNGKEQIYIQKFYLYLNLTKPTDYLYLSFSKVNSEGKNIRPAYLITDIKRLYPLIQIYEEEHRLLSERELTRKAAIPYLIEGIRDRKKEVSKDWEELYTSFRKDQFWKEQTDRLVETGFYTMPQDEISKETAQNLYGDKIEGSVTRLEKFSACAFAHFLTYGLRLKERKEYSFEAVDLGYIFHSAIEYFSRNLIKSGYTWETLTEEAAEKMIEESVETSISEYGNTVLYSSARNEYMITRIKRMMHRTVWALSKQLKKGDFIPSGYEVKFGSGKIDRIDIFEDDDSVYVKIIDYKTGAKVFSLAELYYGLQLQLAVYMNAAMEMEQKKQPDKKVIPAGLFYYRMKDPIIDKVDDEELEDAILKELKPDGIVNSDPVVIDHLDKEFTEASLAAPIKKNKNGSLSKTSKAFKEEDFETISKYVKYSIRKIEEKMKHGTIEISPYEMGQNKGCDYCPFKGVCKFDEKIEGCEYRRLGKLTDDEVLEKMRKEM